ncbi:MAG: NADH:flavin oxidoreductase [Salinicola sp.]|uniref:NADH:flavin oxidoreductase n=1 Tax=Salinicola sp. TaxID=1978524 RepID=UPI001D4F40DA|nr:NADH:flavin oxidoreductase [Salinicola sp.]NRB55997.1 NADH:flavin oxidoreductase [Salinicola sp.]
MVASAVEPLFRPFQLKSLSLPNRIVMAPMTRNFAPRGVPDDDVVAYYRRRAQHGVGLILSEGTVIDRPSARNEPCIPFFHGEAALAGWQRVIDSVQAAGGRMGPQLWHVGAAASSKSNWTPEVPVESPSGLAGPDQSYGRAMTEEDIADTIDAFGRSAADAKRLGFDTVELHGAHGYLLDQFFWGATNLRSDGYGGSDLQTRSRFVAEVVAKVRAAVGEDMPIILRLSQWKQLDFSVRLVNSPDEMHDWLMPLVEAGADILHCSQRRFWEAEFPEVDGEEGLNFAGWAKKLTGAATISVGSVGLSGDFAGAFAGESSSPASLDNLVRRLDRDEFDLIAVGRALLNDPEWVAKIREGDEGALLDFEKGALDRLY